jgi:cytochrome c556
MRRLLTNTTALLLALTGTVAVAQKATNPAELEGAMKRVSAANAITGKAIKSGAFDEAKASVAQVKQALMDAENFWVMNKKDDAVKMSKDAIAKVTALEAAVSAAAPTQEAALAAAKEVGATCTACHMVYRVQNEDKTYSLKPGTI